MLSTLRQRNFTLLLTGVLISQIGDWLLDIGLSIYVYILTGSALATSFALIVAFLPGLLFGSVAGVLVDRWNRRWTVAITNLLQGCGLLPLLAVHNTSELWIVYVVLFGESCLAQCTTPAANALFPNLVSQEQFITANALKSMSRNIARLVGGAAGGIIMALWGLNGVVLLDAASFLFVCVMILLMKMPGQSPLASPSIDVQPAAIPVASMPLTTVMDACRRFGSEWLEGMQLIYRQHTLMILFIMLAVQSLGEGVFGVMLIIFVKKVLGGDALLLGSLMSLQAVGSLIGGALIGLIGQRLSPGRMLGFGTVLFGLIDLVIVNVPLLIPGALPVMILFVLVGIPGTGAQTGSETLFQTATEDRLRGRIYGSILTVQSLLMIIGMVLAGTLGDKLGPILLLNIQGSVFTLSGLLALLTLGSAIVSRQTRRETAA